MKLPRLQARDRSLLMENMLAPLPERNGFSFTYGAVLHILAGEKVFQN
jgi:hypothetical protein